MPQKPKSFDEKGSGRSEKGFGMPGREMGPPGMGHAWHGRGMGQKVRSRNFRSTIARLWKNMGKQRRTLIMVFLLVFISAALGLACPYLIGRAIDAISPGFSSVGFKMLGLIISVLAAVYVMESVVSLSQGFLMSGVSQRVVYSLRESLFAKLQKLPLSFFDSYTHGELMSRLANDVENVSSSISQSTAHLFMSFVTVTGSLIMMLLLDPILTIAGVAVIPLFFIITRFISKRTRTFFRKQQAELGNLSGYMEEMITGLQIVKSFNHEDKVKTRFEAINDRYCNIAIKAQIWSGFLMPMMNVLNNIGFAIVAATGGVMAIQGLVSIGVIASFISYTRHFARPLNEIANIYNMLQSAVAGAERIYDIIDETEEPDDTETSVILTAPTGRFSFEDVTFGYRDDVDVLKNITFEALPGSMIAVVGPTGAGKTTIVNLLTRFYDVKTGRIMVDQTDSRLYTRDSLRKSFGIVLQDTYLFSGTIKDNIKYGNLDASDTEVTAAAAAANADGFIRRLPHGYDTMLSESASNLSQGQRQLLAIARAILSDPPILILDEATSNVDTRTELHIQQAMIKLMKGRTCFIIAHRLNTIRNADLIIVVNNGEIVEKGTHQSLMDSNGLYSELYSTHFGLYEEYAN